MAEPPTTTGAPARRLWRSFWVRLGLVGAGLAVLVVLAWRQGRAPELPDFGSLPHGSTKKSAFFAYLLPKIRAVNADILDERRRLLQVRQEMAAGVAPSPVTRHWLDGLTEEYELDAPQHYDLDFLDRLLGRVDVVAPSLVLAQAAYESGWGTSRFARRGNNLFGLHSYGDADGMVPRQRSPGKKFTLATFDSVRAGIAAYVHNLNTDDHYRQLRRLRDNLRRAGRPVTGPALVGGLDAYSALGAEYGATIRALIRDNALEKFDIPR